MQPCGEGRRPSNMAVINTGTIVYMKGPGTSETPTGTRPHTPTLYARRTHCSIQTGWRPGSPLGQHYKVAFSVHSHKSVPFMIWYYMLVGYETTTNKQSTHTHTLTTYTCCTHPAPYTRCFTQTLFHIHCSTHTHTHTPAHSHTHCWTHILTSRDGRMSCLSITWFGGLWDSNQWVGTLFESNQWLKSVYMCRFLVRCFTLLG